MSWTIKKSDGERLELTTFYDTLLTSQLKKLSCSLICRYKKVEKWLNFCNIHKSNVWFVTNFRYTKTIERCQLSVYFTYLYIIAMYVTCVYTPGIANVQKPGSYGSWKNKNKWCGSNILMTKLVTQTNYYNRTRWNETIEVRRGGV